MKITVERYSPGVNDTIGKLMINGEGRCYTLEDSIRPVKIKGMTSIPEGTYKVGMRYSPKFSPKLGHDMLWVKDVPGYQFILIHPGNSAADTEGCLLVGNSIDAVLGRRRLLNSRTTYLKIYEEISRAVEAGEEVTIQYINPKSHV